MQTLLRQAPVGRHLMASSMYSCAELSGSGGGNQPVPFRHSPTPCSSMSMSSTALKRCYHLIYQFLPLQTFMMKYEKHQY